MHSINTLEFWCWNEECPDYGKQGQGNIVFKETYGNNQNSLFKCTTCGHCLSETRGTPFFELKTPREEVIRTLAIFPEKGSIRGVARASGHTKNTVQRWTRVAAEHCKEVTEYFSRDLNLTIVQIDEIWSYIKKKEKNVTEDDPAECGDCYTLTAMESGTRLWISHHEGDRTADDATELFEDIERKHNSDSEIPLFISDDWDAFEEGLLNVYGTVEQPPYAGVGRKPNPILVPKEGLLYAQVCKKREHGGVVGMVKRIVFGATSEILSILGADTDGKISTSYIERLNLTIRNSLARFIRKTMNFSKNWTRHSKIIDFLQAWYNFVKPHISLRVLQIDGNRKWKQRTPAMAKGLTDHIWKLGELLLFRVPVQ